MTVGTSSTYAFGDSSRNYRKRNGRNFGDFHVSEALHGKEINIYVGINIEHF